NTPGGVSWRQSNSAVSATVGRGFGLRCDLQLTAGAVALASHYVHTEFPSEQAAAAVRRRRMLRGSCSIAALICLAVPAMARTGAAPTGPDKTGPAQTDPARKAQARAEAAAPAAALRLDPISVTGRAGVAGEPGPGP